MSPLILVPKSINALEAQAGEVREAEAPRVCLESLDGLDNQSSP